MIGCPRQICESCLENTTIQDIQMEGAKVWAENGFSRSYGNDFPFNVQTK